MNSINFNGIPPLPDMNFNNNSNEYESTDKIDILKDINDFMEEFTEEEYELTAINEKTVVDGFKANILLKIYLTLENEKEEIKELCNKEIERVKKAMEAYQVSRFENINKKQSYIESVLKQFLLAEIQNKKTKSVKLPYGTLSIKKVQDKYEFNNEEEIVNFLKTINKEDLINRKVTETINKKALKKACELREDGVYIDNVLVSNIKIEEQEDKFEIKKIK